MLYLVKGRAGSGKTEYIRKKIGELALNGESKPVLLVPEQFSFESERIMLKKLGAKKLKSVDVFNFRRMASVALKNSGILSKAIPDKGVKSVLMSEVLKQLEDELQIFSNVRINKIGIDPLLEFCKELKHCCISSSDFNEKIDSMDDCFLKSKLKELSLINDSYDALLSQSYFNDTELLTYFNGYALSEGYFRNKTVFIDGFREFSKQESECLSVILEQADDVYVTVCVDKTPKLFSAFHFMDEFQTKLKKTAGKYDCKFSEIFLEQSENAFSSDIYQLEKNIFSQDEPSVTETDNSVTVAKCSDIEDECKYVAATIKKLLRDDEYRCRDIAIIERTQGKYKQSLIDALKSFGVPVYDDSRRPLSSEVLIIYVMAALDCAFNGFSTEGILRYLKTGLSPLTLDEISKLEKYALIWGLGAKAWKNDFAMNPKGLGSSFDETSEKELEYLNELRKKAVIPLLNLKNACDGQDGKSIAKAIYDFIVQTKVRNKLYNLSCELENDGFSVEASRLNVSWNKLMELLDTMVKLTENKFYSLKRWYELFSLLVSCCDVGEIPQGLDQVTIGNADRIRTEKLKVVFLVGCNKDLFPLVNVKKGILTESDRVTLINDVGLDLREPFESYVHEEKFIGYCAVTAASEKLYMSYRTVGSSDEMLIPSEFIETAVNSIENVRIDDSANLSADYFIENADSAFSVLAKNFNSNNKIESTLRHYFAETGEYNGKIRSLEIAAGKKPLVFENPDVSKRLFGERVSLSASKIDSFYDCPFAYFVRYGLKAEPLELATLDPLQSGKAIHHILENVLKKYDITCTDDDIIKSFVESVLLEYLDKKMGGANEKTPRFMFLYNRFTDIAMTIIARLKAELSVGEFKPCDYELHIGGEEIPAYELPLKDGSVKVTGYVDRVDLMTESGKKYIRVIDYKTGKKTFRLQELLDGKNIQMVLYLMAIEQNGKNKYGDVVPSGVLYLPSRIGFDKYLESRNPSQAEVDANKQVTGQLSGMMLDNAIVLEGMGVDKMPGYFPAEFDSNKNIYKGNLYNSNNFKKLSEAINDKIVGMGESLHSGFVDALPLGSNEEGKACKYCPYKSICGREEKGKVNQSNGLRLFSQAIKRLEAD
ncbi:MAG: hypothetical protein E7533_01340 [Ruminococcaceae bacterium]|nr:hypothetical protein [Oscillospiraceae bacterium]